MHEAEKLTLDQIEAFLNASEEIRFEGENREQVYGWVEQVLRQQQYEKQGRKARGLLRRYLEKVTGLSRAQVTRLIATIGPKESSSPLPIDGTASHNAILAPISNCWPPSMSPTRP